MLLCEFWWWDFVASDWWRNVSPWADIPLSVKRADGSGVCFVRQVCRSGSGIQKGRHGSQTHTHLPFCCFCFWKLEFGAPASALHRWASLVDSLLLLNERLKVKCLWTKKFCYNCVVMRTHTLLQVVSFTTSHWLLQAHSPITRCTRLLLLLQLYTYLPCCAKRH